ncbi:unnamed protein product (macronuclear) [Paramecium tetraurelia]|uniref:Uncharacterized protein n=1 Tax=Paramecium tetraurelia TaxID=5888 RepID=A0DML5_PARTE|nr:uncharacterized protein GSPATT00018500001 [Paramecium tetraurelia]CAK84282.1 unnamed protein product [Paramecium tetraurelia]|eukprot:XP_001451679.1 hypothetical protein (macronuclear) [Paramecium tetraurelia strain d4-2]
MISSRSTLKNLIFQAQKELISSKYYLNSQWQSQTFTCYENMEYIEQHFYSRRLRESQLLYQLQGQLEFIGKLAQNVIAKVIYERQ